MATLGVVSNVMQVVSSSWELVKVVAELRETGSTAAHDVYRRTATELGMLISKLKTSSDASGIVVIPGDDNLNKLAADTVAVAEKLTKLLDRCTITGKRTSWESLKREVTTVWKYNEIAATERKLKTYRDLLQERISVDTNKQMESLSLLKQSRYQTITDSLKSISEAVLDTRADMKTETTAQRTELQRRHDQSDAAAVQRHKETLDTFKNLPIISSVFICSSQEGNVKELDLRKVQKKILDRLDFRQRMDRHEAISQAQKDTFEWLYVGSKSSKISWSNFHEWLRSGSGLYWIEGKAGSGKSTLMKFIDENPRTKTALSIWAKKINGWPVVKASYYFWNSGTEMQKSRAGLLRSLLSQILKEHPSLISLVFSEACKQEEFNFEGFPTYSELRRTFDKVLIQTEKLTNLFLIIDGLDEYDTDGIGQGIDMAEIADYFNSLARVPWVKILISSRPLCPFEEAFDKNLKLRLQDLTSRDIKIFVTEKLEKHSRIQELKREDRNGVYRLVSNIVESADGVFLWVALVTQNLLEGLRNYDTVSELLRRLEEVPKDLDGLYRNMWRRVDPRYYKEASKLLQLVCGFSNPYRKIRWEHMTALTLFFAIQGPPGQAVEAPLRPLDTVAGKLKEIEGRLRSRCFGLLEVQQREYYRNPVEPTRALQSIPEFTIESSVQFLRRSAKGFLNQPEIWQGILAKTESSDFDVNVSLLSSYLLQLKAWKPLGPSDLFLYGGPKVSSIWRLICHAMDLARLYEILTGKSHMMYTRLLDEIDTVVQYQISAAIVDALRENPDLRIPSAKGQDLSLGDLRDVHWSELLIEEYRCNISCAWHDTFLSFAMRSGLYVYVQEKLSLKSKLPHKTGRPLLDYAIQPAPEHKNDVCLEKVNTNMVRLLLDLGADPNESYIGWSPWQNALRCFKKMDLQLNSQKEVKGAHVFCEILELLIVHGADPHAFCEEVVQGQIRRYSALRVICTVFQLTDRDDVKDPYHFSTSAKSENLQGSMKRMAIIDTFQAVGKRLRKLLIDKGGLERSGMKMR